ncbi:MAG: hypothetical protein IPK03_11360 [Bacteroidetes bacterium]|nr:hypothetical protein [Bacteroidota bacterium]
MIFLSLLEMKYLFILFFSIQLNAQRADHEKPRILFILDASYSMNRKWGQEQMWEIAKRTLAEFATNLDKKYGAELALRVYGHKYDVSFNNCNDTELKVPMEFNNSERIKEVLCASIQWDNAYRLFHDLCQFGF